MMIPSNARIGWTWVWLHGYEGQREGKESKDIKTPLCVLPNQDFFSVSNIKPIPLSYYLLDSIHTLICTFFILVSIPSSSCLLPSALSWPATRPVSHTRMPSRPPSRRTLLSPRSLTSVSTHPPIRLPILTLPSRVPSSSWMARLIVVSSFAVLVWVLPSLRTRCPVSEL